MIKKDSTMIRPGLLILVILVAVPTYTVNGQTHYRQPPADVVAILDAPPPPGRRTLGTLSRRRYQSVRGDGLIVSGKRSCRSSPARRRRRDWCRPGEGR